MKFRVAHYVVGPVATNCYFMIAEDTKEAIVIDPGDAGEALAQELIDASLHPVAILLTHGHFDHADGVEDLKKQFDTPIPVYACEAEKETLTDPHINLSGMMERGAKQYHADVFVTDEQILSLAGFEIRVLFTPGHTPGGCCFYFPKEKVLFSGDSLFCGSIGRTDFPKGRTAELVRSVKEKLLTLPEEVTVYAGHNESTTILAEKCYNPFLA